MKNQITIREAITEADIAAFWEQLHTYHMRDIFPDSEDENRKHFLDDTEYRAQIQRVHDRQQDRCYYLFFHRNGQDIGFALPAIFTSEDGKCFILEFCVFPAFRGGGTGRTCADALLSWAKMRGARYAELNYGGDERRLRFWKRVGFVENGADEWGEPLMLLPPADPVPFTVEVLEDPDDWQLRKLEKIGLLPCFHRIVVSEEVGTEKPERAFFDFCIRESGFRPEECLMVGDNLDLDILGAERAGMPALWYTVPENLSRHPGFSHYRELAGKIHALQRI